VASLREYAIPVILTALTGFFMAGLPHLIKSNAATSGYDYAEKLALATEKAHSPASDALPRCTMAQVWQRAIGAGAPHPALAGISVTSAGGTFVWGFSIIDASTGTKVFTRKFPDDCSPEPVAH
jgi:hypothetical protein